jgi:hypothetical protein
MKNNILITSFLTFALIASCSRNKLEPKGFQVNPSTISEEESKVDGFSNDSLFETKPGDILLTGINQYRLIPIYKVNIHKRTQEKFIGSNNFHENYTEIASSSGNQWNSNYLPGLEAVYGYNMVNISHFDFTAKQQKFFFEKPVLIKTLYFPSFSSDTLFYKPVKRNYYLVSAYSEDSNKDGAINEKDIRHLFYFDANAGDKSMLIPEDYSVLRSVYDPGNDYLHVYAVHDANKNGQRDENEKMNIFWVDLRNPKNNGIQY